MATVDEGAVRKTRDIGILIRRADLAAVAETLAKAGFVRDEVVGIITFRDGPYGKPSEGVHLLFTGEKTRPDHPLPAPEIQTVDDRANFNVIILESLVVLKLLSNRDKDRAHLRDMIGVGLIDRSWLANGPPELAPRLEHVLDTPDGGLPGFHLLGQVL